MPAAADELSDNDANVLLRRALAVVQDNFSPEHLPESIHDFLLPISVATCQGMFATTMMMAAAMPALTNGASVELWSQKPSPLALLAIHVAKPQKGKSRLRNAVEMLFASWSWRFLNIFSSCPESKLIFSISPSESCAPCAGACAKLLRKKRMRASMSWPRSIAKP